MLGHFWVKKFFLLTTLDKLIEKIKKLRKIGQEQKTLTLA